MSEKHRRMTDQEFDRYFGDDKAPPDPVVSGPDVEWQGLRIEARRARKQEDSDTTLFDEVAELLSSMRRVALTNAGFRNSPIDLDTQAALKKIEERKKARG